MKISVGEQNNMRENHFSSFSFSIETACISRFLSILFEILSTIYILDIYISISTGMCLVTLYSYLHPYKAALQACWVVAIILIFQLREDAEAQR